MTDTPTRYDVLVCGAGPAGLAATAALASRGLDVACVAPTHPPPLPNTYGCWRDELRELGLESCVASEWDGPRVRTSTSTRALDRTYALIDNTALRTTLVDRANEHGADWREGRVERVARLADGLRVYGKRRGESTEWRADLVVDATGHSPVLCDAPERPPIGLQKAWGAVVTCSNRPLPEGSMTLMDWTPPGDGEGLDTPTFLYAMKLDDHRWFVEETVLIDDSPPSFDALRDALRTRLDRRGIDIETVESTERVEFPMGQARPTPSDRLLPFGTAAGLTHPATGYSVARTLRAATPVAEAVAEAHVAGEAGAARRATDRGFRRMWSEDQQRAHDLLTFGARLLDDLDRHALEQFFGAFFELPDSSWRDYLAGDAEADRVACVMLRFFRRLPWSLRGAIARRAASTAGVELARGASSLLPDRRRGRRG